MVWHDSAGRSLSDYPRPSLAVDTALLTVCPGDSADHLAVFVHRRDPGRSPSEEPAAGLWALPGTFVHEGERLSDAVARSLAVKCGVVGVVPRQLHAFDEPGRDSRGWVVSIAHSTTVPFAVLEPIAAQRPDVALAPIRIVGESPRARLPQRQRGLPFEQDEIVAYAATDLRQRYSAALDPDRLLPEPFTLSMLRRLHEAIELRRWQKDTFRRRAEPDLVATDEMAMGEVGRPARLYLHPASR